ncbi:MAG: hypothetical protein HYT63_03785 [Candidatus Yanofskybacteria bacterium]|nr:hypothetical protein [Candidatus Yanofskybacteria bacterium]
MNKEEKDILIGSLLGDGCLRIMNKCIVPAFSVSHSEIQKDYVFWKYEKLKRWVRTAPWKEERVYHKDRSRKTFSWRFQTLSNDAFTELWKTFYPNGKKIIPGNLTYLLQDSPLALAVWLMDDGNRNHEAVFINTQSFELSEQYKLSEVLKNAFDLHVTVNKHSVSNGRQLYRIRIDTESTRKLPSLLSNYLLPKFYYKIPSFSP